MSSEPSKSTESEELSSKRKRMRISDIKGRATYGTPLPHGGGIITHPTHEDVRQAIADGFFVELPYSEGNQEKLMYQWMAQAGLDPAALGRYIEVATRWHAGRIAALVRDKNDDPIKVRGDYSIHDGTHRIEALEFRGETEVEVIID